jgi:hypothetical protein
MDDVNKVKFEPCPSDIFEELSEEDEDRLLEWTKRIDAMFNQTWSEKWTISWLRLLEGLVSVLTFSYVNIAPSNKYKEYLKTKKAILNMTRSKLMKKKTKNRGIR